MILPTNLLQAAFALGLGVVFLASALPKLRHPRGFVLAVLEYRVLPVRLGWIVGRLLPPLELLVALLLLTGTLVVVAAGIAAALLLCFLAAVGLNLARGRGMDCACFGSKRKRAIGIHVLLEDTLMLAASVLVVVLASGGTLAPWSIWRLASLAGGPGIGAGAAVMLLAGGGVALMLALNPEVRRRARRTVGNQAVRGVVASRSSRQNAAVKV